MRRSAGHVRQKAPLHLLKRKSPKHFVSHGRAYDWDVPKTDPVAGREPDETVFHRLLAWLDQGSDSQGERYIEIRDRLIEYFRRRNCPAADDLADDTLDRVARRLEESGGIDDIVPARYCYIVARFVLLESFRRRGREVQHAADVQQDRMVALDDAAEETDEQERTLVCLERCLAGHTSSERALIVDYYRTDSTSARQARKQLAERLGLTANSLAIRACRIRNRLEACVRKCRGR